MKRCDNCTCDYGSCNWLDADLRCPHCGGELEWFKPAPARALMDALSLDALSPEERKEVLRDLRRRGAGSDEYA